MIDSGTKDRLTLLQHDDGTTTGTVTWCSTRRNCSPDTHP